MSETALIHEFILALTPSQDPIRIECNDPRVKADETGALVVRIAPIPGTQQRVRLVALALADLPDYRRSIAASSLVGEVRTPWEPESRGARSPEYDIGRDVDVLVVVINEALNGTGTPALRPIQRRFKIRYQGGDGEFSDG